MKYTVKIEHDEDPMNPRDWDNLGTMACFHKRYNLGDNHDLSIEEVKEIAKSKDYISLPLYLYDHSGITMNTSGFSCPWDSGQVGIIFVSKEDVRKNYGVKRITTKIAEKAYSLLKAEVEEYDKFITGDCWGYIIEKEDIHTNEYGRATAVVEEIESCWGFLGREFCEEEAQSSLNWHIKNNPEQLELSI